MSGFSQNEWSGKLTLNSLECEGQKACYLLQIKNNSAEDWALGDQNYRLFYDAELISIESVVSLLPQGYSPASIEETLELVGQGQEDFSPLDDFDDNLGFLDFNILSTTRYAPAQAVKVTENFISIAEICLNVSEEALTQTGKENSLNIYFSRPETAGKITQQYSIISELAGVNQTVQTRASNLVDLNFSIGNEAQLAAQCIKETAVQNIIVYPNPNYSEGILRYKEEGFTLGTHDVIISDLKGVEILILENLPNDNRELKIDKQLTAGIYILKIKTDQKTWNQEFVIIKK